MNSQNTLSDKRTLLVALFLLVGLFGLIFIKDWLFAIVFLQGLGLGYFFFASSNPIPASAPNPVMQTILQTIAESSSDGSASLVEQNQNSGWGGSHLHKFALDQHAIVSITDAMGSILYANDKLCEISEYETDELVGQAFGKLTNNENDLDSFDDIWQTVTHSSELWQGMMCQVSKYGKQYWVLTTIMPFTHEKETSYFIISTDISSIKELENEAQRSKKWQSSILNNLGDGVFTLSEEGHITYLNAQAKKILGWQFNDINTKSIHDLLYSNTPDLDSPLDISIKNREEFYSDTLTFLNKEGQGIPVNIISKPLYFNNTFAGFTLCFRDATEFKRTESELVLQKEMAEQSADAKLHFLSRITHEIRTPLNGIIGMTDLLLDSKLDDSQLEFAQVIKSSSTNLLTILNGVSDFSKMESSNIDVDQSSFDITDVVDDCIYLCAPHAHKKSLPIVSYIDSQIPANVVGDAMRLGQVLSHFLNNALKFATQGRIIINVYLLNQIDSTIWVRFDVIDNGIGLSSEAKQQIFNPLAKSNASAGQKHLGSGLSLSICYKIVELMCGKIGVDSELGSGSTFWIELPFNVSSFDLKNVRVGALRNRPLLILQEHGFYVAYLQELGLLVDTCNSGSEIINVLKKSENSQNFHKLLLIEEQTDAELLNTVQSLRATCDPQLPIIVCQSTNSSEMKHALMKSGATLVLDNPLKKSVLLDSLMSVLE